MSEEKLDKLLSVMLEMKKSNEEFRKESNEKLDKIESSIDRLTSKTWNNEEDINRLKMLMGIK